MGKSGCVTGYDGVLHPVVVRYALTAQPANHPRSCHAFCCAESCVEEGLGFGSCGTIIGRVTHVADNLIQARRSQIAVEPAEGRGGRRARRG